MACCNNACRGGEIRPLPQLLFRPRRRFVIPANEQVSEGERVVGHEDLRVERAEAHRAREMLDSQFVLTEKHLYVAAE